jgi:perosamine synthetase
MSDEFIPIAAPVLNGNEKKYLVEAIESGWISAYGRFVDDFESRFAAYCGTRHAIACCNGTAALHAALLAVGIGAGDEVLVPSLCFVAAANAVTYCGARPVLVDSEEDSWNVDPSGLERAITPRTKAIIPVHLYGHLCDMKAIHEIADHHNLVVIEDAAEALGAEKANRKAGNLSDIASFSLFGNKIITSGEGGVVVTNDDALADRVRLFRGQGMDVNRRYWFAVVGHNYRMTNLVAAVGLGQLEMIDWHLEVRKSLYDHYLERLQQDSRIILQKPIDDSTIAPWLFSIRIRNASSAIRDEIGRKMFAKGIETRPVFYPMHVLPPYLDERAELPICEGIAEGGLSLPLWAGLTKEDVDRVCDVLQDCLDGNEAQPLPDGPISL